MGKKPSNTPPMDTTSLLSDHDLLIRLNENVSSMRTEWQTATVAMTEKLSDHEARIRLVEAANDRNEGGTRSVKTFLGVGGFIVALVDVLLFWYIGTHR